ESRHHRARGGAAPDCGRDDQERAGDEAWRRRKPGRRAEAPSEAADAVTSPEGGIVQQEVGGEGVCVLTAAAIAEAVGGELRGDPDAAVTGVAALDRATRREMSFLAGAKYAPLFASSQAGVGLIVPELADMPGPVPARVIVARPHEALLSLLPRFHRAAERTPGIHSTAHIGRGVRLGRDVSLAAYTVIGDGVALGDRVAIDA